MVSYQHRCHLITESKKRVESVFSLSSLHQNEFKFWISGWASKIKYHWFMTTDHKFILSPTKIISSDTKDYKIGTFKVIFQYHESIIFFSSKNISLGAALLIFNRDSFCFPKLCQIFVCVAWISNLKIKSWEDSNEPI